MRKIILMLGIVASSVMPAKAAEEASLPNLLTIAYATCERADFLRAANAFPLDSKKLAAIELAATKLNQTVQNTPEKKSELCQSALLVIEQRHASEVMTWDTPTAQLVWLDFIIKTLKAQQVAPKYENIISEGERMENCPNANADGKVTIRGMVEDCAAYGLYCSNFHAAGYHLQVARLTVMGAPKEVVDPVRRADEADLECYKKARADGASGWTPAYECPTADKLRPKAEATYKAYVATHPLPWKTPKEECVALNAQQPARAATSAQDLLAVYTDLNEMCRGWSGDVSHTAEVCAVRQKVSNLLKKMNYCFGKRGQAGGEMWWHPCAADSLR